MSDATPDKERTDHPIVVASVVGNDRVVINRGAEDGIRVGYRYLVYQRSDEEVYDPITGESLGILEIPKGTGRVVHVQERMATLESEQEVRRRRSAWEELLASDIGAPQSASPFRSAKVGDLVKRIS